MLKSSFFRDRAKRALSGCYKNSIGVCFLATLLGGICCLLPAFLVLLIVPFVLPESIQWSATISNILCTLFPIFFVYSALLLLLGPGIRQGVNNYFCELILGHHVDMWFLIPKLSYFAKALALHILIVLKVLLWSCLFLVPGILAAYRYSMAPYILAEDPDMHLFEVLKQSSDLMKRKKRNLFFLQLSFLGWILLGICTAGLGFLFIFPYMEASFAAFYIEISGQNKPFENYADRNSLDYA